MCLFPGLSKQLKQEGVLCSVIEHDMSPISLQTTIQKNEAKQSSFVQFGNEMASYHTL